MRWVAATEVHAKAVARSLRPCDVHELLMAGYRDPEQECMMSYFHTPGTRAILGDNGQPVGLFGLGGGIIWMLGTEELTATPAHRRQLARGARAWVEQLRLDRVEACNWAFSANATGIRWLQSLGFRVHHPEPHGPYGMLFRYFHL
jgi:hypothetical protein